MSDYLASLHHLRMIQVAFGKDQHGLRERDIDHKDKQNFNAVLNIIRASPLEKILVAVGTKHYIDMIQCVVDSYLSKELDLLSCVGKIWYATFFLRYWRQWILLHRCISYKHISLHNCKILAWN